MIAILKSVCGFAALLVLVLVPVACAVAGLIWLWDGVTGARSRERLARIPAQRKATR